MVHRHEAAFFFAPLEHREVDHPKQGKLVLVAQAKAAAHFEAQFAELLARLHGVGSRNHQDKVAGLCAGKLFEALHHLGCVELIYGALHIALLINAGVNKALRADLRRLHKVSQLVQLLARIGSAAFGHNRADIGCLVEHAELASAFQHVHHLDELHAEAHVGLVAAEAAHRFVPRQAQERRIAEVVAAHLFEEILGHFLKSIDNIVLLHKTHFAVNLREFRLAVSAEVFVAEAFHDLEIAVHACHHEQLLERLRALRQGVELSGVHARGDDEVARTFRRRTYEHRRFNFEKAFLVKEMAHGEAELMAQFQVAAHHFAAQVEIAVLHAQFVAAVGVFFDGEGRHVGGVEHGERGHSYFNVARRHLVVLRVALAHGAHHLDNVFAPQFVGLCAKFGVGLFVKHELRDAVAVAQVDKRHAAHLAHALHPAGKRHGLADIIYTEFSASLCSIHIILY